MTEREWRGKFKFDLYIEACEWLLEEKKNHRKLLLWSCACCRRLGDLLTDQRSWKAIEAAERKADGLAKKDEVGTAREAAKLVPRIRERLSGTPQEWAASAPVFLLNPSAAEFSQTAALRASIAMAESGATTRDAEDQLQFEMLRDIFGNPFRPVAFDREWRTSTVASLAKSMYESRDSSTMPILGDALQDAGCEQADILKHCGGGGPHVRGCWVVDLVLGRR
jgi:hypothetical protein